MKQFLESRYILLGFLSAFVLKTLFLGATWTDIGVLTVLGSLCAFYEFKTQDKAIQLVHKRMDLIDNHLTEQNRKVTEVHNYVSGMKMQQNIKFGQR